jgi:hypothetical protein
MPLLPFNQYADEPSLNCPTCVFSCIVESGSITGRAERAHMALASATRIRNMEDALGRPAGARPAGALQTTDAGRAWPITRMMAQQMGQLRDELGQYAGAEGSHPTLVQYLGHDRVPARCWRASWRGIRTPISNWKKTEL